jgi:predicted dehydrogenase
MSLELNIGILGCGMWEEIFSNNSQQNFNVVKIFTEGNVSSEIVKRYPNAEIVSSADQIITDPSISLVFVSPAHLEFANQAIGLGKSVRIAA